MIWSIAYFACPIVFCCFVRRSWYAIAAASAINVPIIWMRVVYLESQLGNPPDYDGVLLLAVYAWALATVIFNSLVVLAVKGVGRLYCNYGQQ
jgi:hypothetical protein